ncbi:hypothetical protein [uncultured Pontibacter sp.]|uniref:hypothetical protein n=1 Tax=uncultured Pontibacter sp. TaxID=453356 RepID=UPI002630C1EE|nr:hypothetical protein [uncultured Pontibacter sp.]
MKNLVFTLLLAGCSLSASAQQELIHPKERQHDVVMQEPQPYIQINGQQINKTTLALLSPDNIASIEVLKDANATTKFGEKAKDGAILIKTNPATKLAKLQDIYTHFGIPAAQQQLQVVINNQLVKDTGLILANLDQIEKVEVVKQEITAPVRWSLNEDEEFLHIIAKPQTK